MENDPKYIAPKKPEIPGKLFATWFVEGIFHGVKYAVDQIRGVRGKVGNTSVHLELIKDEPRDVAIRRPDDER